MRLHYLSHHIIYLHFHFFIFLFVCFSPLQPELFNAVWNLFLFSSSLFPKVKSDLLFFYCLPLRRLRVLGRKQKEREGSLVSLNKFHKFRIIIPIHFDTWELIKMMIWVCSNSATYMQCLHWGAAVEVI